MAGQAAVASALDRITQAPFAPDLWPEALRFLALATGGSFAQFAVWTGPGELPVNIAWNEPAGMMERWVEIGGTDPSINPVIRVGMQTAELHPVTDEQIVPLSNRKKVAIWGEFYEPYDLPHLCFTPLWRDGSAQSTLVICRSARAGVLAADERARFGVIARHWRQAALLAQAIGAEGAKVLTGAFEALSVSAIALDPFGRAVALSPAAEKVLQNGSVITISQGRLTAENFHAAGKLKTAVAPYCTSRNAPPPRTVELLGADGQVMRVRICALPRSPRDIGFGAVAMIIIESQAPTPRLSLGVLLTPAEREIAIALLEGNRPENIARYRGVSLNTVRTQIKTIYAKANVTGYNEFIAEAKRL